MRLISVAAMASVALVAAVACGSDDSGGGTNTGGGGGTGATGGAGGSGGGGGSGGSGNIGGGGGSGGSGGASGSGGSSGGASGGGGAGATGGGGSGGAGGGSGGSGGSGGGGTSPDCKKHASATFATACNSYATTYCKLMWKCAPAFMSLFALDSEAQCSDRFEKTCLLTQGAPGNNSKAALYAAYAELIGTVTCNDFYSGAFNDLGGGTLQPECGGPGTLADGKGCYSGTQCKSGDCDNQMGEACGKCEAELAVGATCDFDSDCGKGLFCDTNDKCAVDKKLGQSCTFSSDCEDGAFCGSSSKVCVAKGGVGATCSVGECKDNLVCGSAKTCKTPNFGALGATCDSSEQYSCNWWAGLECDKTTLKCIQSPSSPPGSKCGMIATDGGFTYAPSCSGSTCVTPNGQSEGTCMKPAADGATCDPNNGPPCLFPAGCVSGKCTLPSPTVCPPG